ncbi:MAG: hypothetical protein WD995_02990 [Gemmatimonadota bacterium]
MERTPWPHWAEAVYWGVLVLVSYPILAGWDTDVATELRLPVALTILVTGLALWWVIRGLTVRVDEAGISMHLGRVPVLSRHVRFDEIVALEVVRYRPLREFGGWGIRGWGKKKAWTARGDQAVRLQLTDERELYIGSDVPQRLAERVRTIGGRQPVP